MGGRNGSDGYLVKVSTMQLGTGTILNLLSTLPSKLTADSEKFNTYAYNEVNWGITSHTLALPRK